MLVIAGCTSSLRVVAPQADPFVFPIAVLLNGVGIAEIYRIDIANGAERLGCGRHPPDRVDRDRDWWSPSRSLLLIRNHRVLQRYRYIAMFSGDRRSCCFRCFPVIGRTIYGARVWIGIGPFSFQPGELAKIALAIFFAGYLVTARDSLSMVGRKFLGMRFPRARDLGPILVVWLHGDGGHRLPARPRNRHSSTSACSW